MGIDGTLSRRELLREGLTLAAVATIAAAALRAWRDRNRYDDLDGALGGGSLAAVMQTTPAMLSHVVLLCVSYCPSATSQQ
jgi:hypothetical protein